MQHNWYEHVSVLRTRLEKDAHGAGTEALRLLEDWLYENATDLGFRNERSGMANFIEYIQQRGRLSKSEAARARRYVDVRNCISHRSGLLISPPLAEELLDFMATLFRREAMAAAQLMTPSPQAIGEADPLLEARDRMLRHDISRLPVLRDGRVVALLTNRDILSQQVRSKVASPTVADAMSADSLEKVVFLPPEAPYDEVLAHLQGPHVAAVFVTERGDPKEPLLGIISVSDVLAKL